MKKYLIILIFASLLIIPIASALAIGDAVTPAGIGDATTPCPGNNCRLDNPLKVSTPQAFIGIVINSILGIVGSIALLMFIYGGLTWMTSSGSAEKVKKGRDIILWSAVGLFVIFSAYALTRYVLSTIAK